MIKAFDVAISVAIIFVIVFVWIVIILRRGILNSHPCDAGGTDDTLGIISNFKEEATYIDENGDPKINRKVLAKLIYTAILKGEWNP